MNLIDWEEQDLEQYVVRWNQGHKVEIGKVIEKTLLVQINNTEEELWKYFDEHIGIVHGTFYMNLENIL